MIIALRWGNVLIILLTLLSYLSPHVNPRVFWPVAFSGLIYPWLLLGNIGFIVLWLILGRSYFLFSLGCILIGYVHFTSLVGLNFFPKKTAAQGLQLKVMSYNVHRFRQFRDSKQKVDLQPFLEMVEAKAIDLLFVQELPESKRHLNVVNALARQTRLQHYYVGPQKGLAIFSAYPLKAGETVYTNAINGYQYADIDLGGRQVRAFNLHLHSNGLSSIAHRVAEKGDIQKRRTWRDIKGMLQLYKRSTQRRAQQAEAVAGLIDQTELPVVLGGDFNDIPQSYSYYQLTRRLQDAFRVRGVGLGTTYTGDIPGLRIDYILSSPRRFRVLQYQRGASGFSDHRPVFARLELLGDR